MSESFLLHLYNTSAFYEVNLPKLTGSMQDSDYTILVVCCVYESTTKLRILALK